MRYRITADPDTLKLRNGIIAHVRGRKPDLSLRQLAIFLTCYVEDEEQTIPSLAARLRICKPAVSRALDRLETLKLTRRAQNPKDRRSFTLQRTRTGADAFWELCQSIAQPERVEAGDGSGSGPAAQTSRPSRSMRARADR